MNGILTEQEDKAEESERERGRDRKIESRL